MDMIKGTAQMMQQAASGNSGAFGQVASELVKLKHKIREAIQDQTTGTIKGIIHKLEQNQPLSAAEKETVKLWVVGDAQGYVKLTESLKEWQAEYRRLCQAIGDLEAAEPSVPNLVALHGLTEDAIKVADEIAHFLEDKERLERFEQAINKLDAADSKFIAELLKGELASPDY